MASDRTVSWEMPTTTPGKFLRVGVSHDSRRRSYGWSIHVSEHRAGCSVLLLNATPKSAWGDIEPAARFSAKRLAEIADWMRDDAQLGIRVAECATANGLELVSPAQIGGAS